MKRIALIVFSIVLFSCKTSYQKQTSSCFEKYTALISDCTDGDCETRILDNFQSCMGRSYVFPLHFVVLTDSLKGTDEEILEELQAVVDTLNKNFTVEDSRYPPDNRKKVVSFTFKSATLFDEATAIGGDLVDHAVPTYDLDSDKKNDFQDFMNATPDGPLKSESAINVYIVDSWETKDGKGYTDVTGSNGRNNKNHPYMALDYARITGKSDRVGAEEHEMGHCFLLAHVCEPGSTNTTSTNIMASPNNYPADNTFENGTGKKEAVCKEGTPSGRSGKRDIGFNREQCVIILNTALDIKNELGL